MKFKFRKNRLLILIFLFFSLILTLPFLNIQINLEIKKNNINDDGKLKFSATDEIIEDWNQTILGYNEVSIGGTAVDHFGNVYIVGGNGSSGTNIIIQKYDPNGTLLWSRTKNGNSSINSYDAANDVAIDSLNNIYITGEINKEVGVYNLILLKYNNEGEYQWNKTWIDSSAETSFGKSIVIDKLDNIYVAGNFRPNPPDWSKSILLKYDSSGNLLWEKFHTASKYTYTYDVELDSKGYIYVAGDNHSGSNNPSIWVSKYTNSSSDPNSIKNITYSTLNDIERPSIDFDSDDYLYISSTNYTSSYSNSNQILLLIYNSEGSLVEERPYFLTDTKSEEIRIEDNSGDIFIIGTNRSSDYFSSSALIIKYNSSYQFQWNKTWKPNEIGISGKAITLDIRGHIYSGILGNYKYFLTKYNFTIPPGTFNLCHNATNPDTNGNFTLSWERSFNARNYTIYRYDKPITTVNESLTIINQGLKSTEYKIKNQVDSIYYYAIAANNPYGNTLSNNISVHIQLTPQNFTLSTNASSPDTDGIFLLEWTPSQFANNYSIYNDTNPINTIHNGLEIVADNITDLNFTISLTRDETIYYVVVAFNDNGNTLSNNVVVTTELYPRPFTLTSNETQDYDGFYTLDWTDSIRANNYTLYSYDKCITEINNSLTMEASEITELAWDISLNQDDIYYYIILAQNDNGNTTSNCISVEVTIIPKDFTLTANETRDYDGFYTLNWTPSDKTNNYTVYSYEKCITEINNSLTMEANEITELAWDISLNQDDIYYYIILAQNDNGNTTSNCISVEVTIIPRDFTLNVNETHDYNGFYTLNWTPSDKANYYTVYSYDSFITEVNASLTVEADEIGDLTLDISLNQDGIYYYIAVAFNDYGNTMSNCVSVEVTIIPRNFTLSSNAESPDIDGNFQLTWTPSDKANNYTAYQHSDYITEINNSLIIVTQYIDIRNFNLSLNEDGLYYYIIIAFNNYGNSSSNVIVVDVSLPPKSFNLTSNATYPDVDGSFILIWDESNRAQNYTLYNSSKFISNINGSLGLVALEINQLNWTFTNLAEGRYFFIVVANNDYGNTNSQCIEIWVRYPPSNFSLIDDAGDPERDGLFYLNWTDSDRALNYSIYFSNKYISEFNSSVYLIDSGLIVNFYHIFNESGNYYYQIVAYNEAGNTTSNNVFISIQIPPGNFSIFSDDAGNPDQDGEFRVEWTNSIYTSYYVLYYSLDPINDINENELTLLYNGTNLFFDIAESHNFDDNYYHFVVISENEYGNNTSNELIITVGNPNALTDSGMPWWLQAIFTGIISASAGLVIKLSFSRYKKRKEFYNKMTEKFEKVDNIESFLEENLGYDEWQRLKEPLDQYKRNQISEKDLIKKGKKELGDRFTELLKK